MDQIFAGIFRRARRRTRWLVAAFRGQGHGLGTNMGAEFRLEALFVILRVKPGIATIAADMDIFYLIPDRQCIERQVGFDVAAMGLGLQRRQASSMESKIVESSHGETSPNGLTSGDWNTNRSTILWVQVVPHLANVAMTMSPSLGSN